MHLLILFFVCVTVSSAAPESDNVATDEPCWEEVEAFDFVYHEKIYKWVQVDCNSKSINLR
jgi:hypothetical protein